VSSAACQYDGEGEQSFLQEAEVKKNKIPLLLGISLTPALWKTVQTLSSEV